MHGTVIVWDLETVPDLRGFAAAHGLVGKTDHEIRDALGSRFPKHIYHAIVCIGALVAHHKDDRWQVDALGAPHVGERTENRAKRSSLRPRCPAAPSSPKWTRDRPVGSTFQLLLTCT